MDISNDEDADHELVDDANGFDGFDDEQEDSDEECDDDGESDDSVGNDDGEDDGEDEFDYVSF